VVIPALGLLLGPQAPHVLAAAIGGYGGRLAGLHASTVHVQPTGAAVVVYLAAVVRGDGSCTSEVLAATTGGGTTSGILALFNRSDQEQEHLRVRRATDAASALMVSQLGCPT
jgi:hypothetical protein